MLCRQIRLAVVLALPLLSLRVSAQTADPATIRRLQQRVDQLEQELEALKAELKAAASVPAAPPAAIPPAAPPVIETAADVPGEPNDRWSLHVLGDVDFFHRPARNAPNRFALGELDLFATARVASRVSLLAEGVLELDNTDGTAAVPIGIERLLLRFRGNDYFNVDAGIYQTAIGYYSTAALRGAWFQVAATRPILYSFEDDGGFLPLHNMGIDIHGDIPSGPLGLHYIVQAGNARNFRTSPRPLPEPGASPDPAATAFSNNIGLNLALRAHPRVLPGLEIGYTNYRDRLSPYDGIWMDRRIQAVHAVYAANRIEFLNEVVRSKVTHPLTRDSSITSFYSQLAYRAGRDWQPYVRYEWSNVIGVPASSPSESDTDSDRGYLWYKSAVLAGARRDLSRLVALKFQLGRATSYNGGSWILGSAQLAFTF